MTPRTALSEETGHSCRGRLPPVLNSCRRTRTHLNMALSDLICSCLWRTIEPTSKLPDKTGKLTRVKMNYSLNYEKVRDGLLEIHRLFLGGQKHSPEVK